MSSVLQRQLTDALDFMPVHRQKFKRTQKLNLDILLEDYRALQTLDAGTLDFILMGYRYTHIFQKVLAGFLSKPLSPPEISDLLQITFAALLTRTQVPAPVLVHEAVELAGSHFGPFTKGFTNAFFRQILRDKDQILAAIDKNPTALLGDELAQRLSKPAAQKMAQQLMARPDSGIWAFDKNLHYDTHKIDEFSDKSEPLQAMDLGSWTFCEWATKQIVEWAAGKNSDIKALDACAAPGGKLIALHLLLKKQGLNVHWLATDAKQQRLDILNHNIKRFTLQDDCLTQLKSWGEKSGVSPQQTKLKVDGPYDIIFADLPCTGSGTLHTRPDLLTEDFANRLVDLAPLQKAILRDLQANLKPGGLMIVSVCSIDEQELKSISETLGQKEPAFESLKTLNQRSEGICGWVFVC